MWKNGKESVPTYMMEGIRQIVYYYFMDTSADNDNSFYTEIHMFYHQNILHYLNYLNKALLAKMNLQSLANVSNFA